jgi:hypothetical protein
MSAARSKVNVRKAIVLWLLCGSLLDQCAEAQDRTLRFAGEVARGLTFRKNIGRGLDFVLKPLREQGPGDPNGWTIKVSPRGSSPDSKCDDFVWVVTPPFRSGNPRYLSTEYGNTAQEAVGNSPREFRFVLNCEDFKTEYSRVERVLWPYNYSEKDVEESLAKLGTSPTGTGLLWIKDSKFRPGEKSTEPVKYGEIHWIKFEVEIKFPEDSRKPPKP